MQFCYRWLTQIRGGISLLLQSCQAAVLGLVLAGVEAESSIKTSHHQNYCCFVMTHEF